MNRLVLILAASLVFSAMSGVAPARAETDAELLQRIQDYLNALTTLDARFTQRNHDGSQAQGEFQLKRPQFARIAYDDPATEIVVRGQVIQIWDGEVGQYSEGPASAWPASILLRADLDLSEVVNQRGLRRDGDFVFLTVEPSDEPGAGVLTLIFDDPVGAEDEPLELAEWSVRDAQGYITRVNLDSAEFGVPLANSRFEIDHMAKIRPGTSSD